MNETVRRAERAIASIGLTIALVAPGMARAQAGAGLPAAKDLIAKYDHAVGGDQWKKHKSSRMKATMDMGTMTATMEVVQIFGSGVASRTQLGAMGELRNGYDGTVAWQLDPMRGPRVLTGSEADAVKDAADPEKALRISPDIVSAETLEKTSMDGRDCYKVKITFKNGNVATDCYGVADGLLVATTTKVSSQMGEMEVTQYQSEYKDFAGAKRATVMTSEMMGQRITITMTAWEWDNVDPKELELPAEIKALVKNP
jgi:hypothetical protein